MKNLKIAEIVPVSCLAKTKDNQYHMCLAHLVGLDNDQSRSYTEFFHRMSTEGKYVLMDNGAAEGSQLPSELLIEAYKMINPTEIVLPDSLCDPVSTIAKTTAFYEHFKNDIKGIKLMVVPQGNTFDEWCSCVVDLIANVPVNTIGVSKFLEMATGERDIRIRACEFLKRFDVEIHLLGCSEGPLAVRKARLANPKVRGCDSAFVYICSKSGVKGININSKREEGEIDFLNDAPTSNLSVLMSQFEDAVGVVTNKCDDSWG